jgi:hypothetical protein
VLPDGTLKCRIIEFRHIDPEELPRAKRAHRLPKHVTVRFNEASLPAAPRFRAEAVRLIRRLCVGRKVTVSLGIPDWPKGKVIGDVEISRASQPNLQLELVSRGLASYRSDGGPTDDVMYDAEQSARSRRVGMWADRRH